jgi:hypothetical protein
MVCGFTKLEVMVPFLRLNKWRMFETTSQLRWIVEIYLSYYCCGYWYNRTICHIVYIYTTYHITSYHILPSMLILVTQWFQTWNGDAWAAHLGGSSLCDVNHGNNCCCCGHHIDKSLQYLQLFRHVILAYSVDGLRPTSLDMIARRPPHKITATASSFFWT